MSKAKVILFRPSGKYYTEEEWEVPPGAIGPYDLKDSSDFRRIGGGAVLVDSQEPWGYPHLFPNDRVILYPGDSLTVVRNDHIE